MPLTPEQQARQQIDALLADAGWLLAQREARQRLADESPIVRVFRASERGRSRRSHRPT